MMIKRSIFFISLYIFSIEAMVGVGRGQLRRTYAASNVNAYQAEIQLDAAISSGNIQQILDALRTHREYVNLTKPFQASLAPQEVGQKPIERLLQASTPDEALFRLKKVLVLLKDMTTTGLLMRAQKEQIIKDYIVPFIAQRYAPEGNTLLHYATKKQDKDLTLLLLSYGADLAIKNENGETPIQIVLGTGGRGTDFLIWLMDVAKQIQQGTKSPERGVIIRSFPPEYYDDPMATDPA